MTKPAVSLLLAVYVSLILIELATLPVPAYASPPVTSHTPAKLTNNDFSSGGGSGPSECDQKFHDNSELIVALSTGWYDHGSRCGMDIQITAENGETVVAKVVDECDEHRGCDNNIVDGSEAVWKALGLNVNVGVVPVHWAMA